MFDEKTTNGQTNYLLHFLASFLVSSRFDWRLLEQY